MSQHDDENELNRLRAEIARLKAEKAATSAGGLGLRVSEKGAVSVYGIGRFPVTLYAEQWERLIAQGERILAFIRENRALLAKKATPGETK